MNYNYHAHTVYCRHAKGTMEEYVTRAYEMGVRHMGFSDHFPFRFPDGFEKSWRVQISEADMYIRDVCELREKYKGKIDIFLGFEMEYYSEFFDEMLKNAETYGADYLILGQHFINASFDYPNNVHTVLPTDSENMLVTYADSVTAAIASGVFTYVAHPDIFNFTGDDGVYTREMARICEASAKYDVPLEINFLGIRERRCYPRESFWKIAREFSSPVTFGFDAHDVMAAYDSASLPRAMELVQRYELNYIGEPTLRAVKAKK